MCHRDCVLVRSLEAGRTLVNRRQIIFLQLLDFELFLRVSICSIPALSLSS